MEGPAPLTRGALLRAWRENAGLSEESLAAKIYRSRPAVSLLELDRRQGDGPTVEAIARSTGGDALPGLWRAVGTRDALPPRAEWMHNPEMPGAPVWAWLRSRDEEHHLVAAVHWGEALHGHVDEATTAAGVLVQFPTSVSNPPLTISLSQPGWVDFGTGWVPRGVADRLGVALVNAQDLHVAGLPDGVPTRTLTLENFLLRALQPLFSRVEAWAQRLGVRWSLVQPHLGIFSLRPLTIALDGRDLEVTVSPGPLATGSDGGLESQLLLSPAQLRALREGRGLSRAEVAQAVTAHEPLEPVRPRDIERLETDGRPPQAARALTRLASVYEVDGRLAVERLFSHQVPHGTGRPAPYAYAFPSYWTGPVWVQVRAPEPDSAAVMDLRWGPWRRRQKLRSGAVVSTRKAPGQTSPLFITLPSGWHVCGGTGSPPTALNINEGWRPTSLLAATTILNEALQAVEASWRQPQGLAAPGRGRVSMVRSRRARRFETQ